MSQDDLFKQDWLRSHSYQKESQQLVPLKMPPGWPGLFFDLNPSEPPTGTLTDYDVERIAQAVADKLQPTPSVLDVTPADLRRWYRG